jgi:hypothetical protein
MVQRRGARDWGLGAREKQKAEGRRQKAEGRRQKAEGRRQKADLSSLAALSILGTCKEMVTVSS